MRWLYAWRLRVWRRRALSLDLEVRVRGRHNAWTYGRPSHQVHDELARARFKSDWYDAKLLDVAKAQVIK